MIFKDYYKILGLSTSKATNEEIKLAYREQAKKYHPDINSNNRFSEERYYFNLIYGDTLRKKNTKLTEIESEINNLENKNYTIVTIKE